MTNEEIATQLKQEYNKDIALQLWDSVKHLLFLMAGRNYNNNISRFTARGISLDDIKQECFNVMLGAVKGYKPDQQLKFTAYIKFPFKTMIYTLLGIRTSKKDILDDCTSLDDVIISGDNNIALEETIKDNTVDIECELCDKDYNSYATKVLNNEVDKLPANQKNIIQRKYSHNKSLMEIAKETNSAYSNIRQEESKALRSLRLNKDIQGLMNDELLIGYSAYHSGISSFNNKWMSNVEMIVEQRNKAQENRIQEAKNDILYLKNQIY